MEMRNEKPDELPDILHRNPEPQSPQPLSRILEDGSFKSKLLAFFFAGKTAHSTHQFQRTSSFEFGFLLNLGAWMLQFARNLVSNLGGDRPRGPVHRGRALRWTHGHQGAGYGGGGEVLIWARGCGAHGAHRFIQTLKIAGF